MKYVDGFVAAVPAANKARYLHFAKSTAAVFKEHGALSVVDCWGDEVPEGKLNSMHTAVMRKPDETIVFSWVMWPSKAVRDNGMAQVMADPRMSPGSIDMPFDGQRMIMGGFEQLLDA